MKEPTDKGKRVANHTNHDRNALGWPPSAVVECVEDARGIAVLAHGHQSDQDADKGGDVHHQDANLNLGQQKVEI